MSATCLPNDHHQGNQPDDFRSRTNRPNQIAGQNLHARHEEQPDCLDHHRTLPRCSAGRGRLSRNHSSRRRRPLGWRTWQQRSVTPRYSRRGPVNGMGASPMVDSVKQPPPPSDGKGGVRVHGEGRPQIVDASCDHEPTGPLTPTLSPDGGEGEEPAVHGEVLNWAGRSFLNAVPPQAC